MATLTASGGGNVRQSAAQVAVPKGSTVTISHTASPAKAGGVSAPKAAQKVAGPAASKAAANTAFNPVAGYLSTPQLTQLAKNITSEQLKATLAPLRGQASQIQNSENTVAGRYAGYNATGDQILQGLQTSAAGSALTAGNQAAQQAQQTANVIDASGKAAAALNGGYLDPNVAAALQNASTYNGTVGGAQAALAANQGQANENFMGQLRGTAALQAIEGQGTIAGTYAKQLATNRSAQDTAILKAIPTEKDLASTLGQQQFSDAILAKEAGAKTLTAKANAAAATENAATRQYAAVTARQAAVGKINYDNALASIDSQKVGVTEQLGLIKDALTKKGLSIQQTKNLETFQADLAKISAAQTSTASPTAKATALITPHAQLYRDLINVPNSKGVRMTPAQAQATITQSLKSDGFDAQAAIEIGTQGYITAATAAGLQSQGVQVPAAWLVPPKGTPAKATAKAK